MLNKLLPIFCGGLITISISISGWTMKEVVALRTEVAAMQSSRFTNEDGLAVWKAIAAIKEQVVQNAEKIQAMPLQGPPPWFVDQVKSMEGRINTRLEKVEEKIDKIPKK